MALVTMRGVTLGFGGPSLLEKVDLQIERGERVCLVGRNGTGKSTLMKLISGELTADDGELVFEQGVRVRRLTQEVPAGQQGTVYDAVAEGLGEEGELLAEYHRVSARLAAAGAGEENGLLPALEKIQHRLEAVGGWGLTQRVDTVISRLQLPPEQCFAELSGGLKRRVLLAKALVAEPDLLVLDEPTNHLDVDSIEWLENFLLGFGGTLLFVTHDRRFLQRLATRIIELDRGRLTSWPGDYDTYLRRKQAVLEAEAEQNALFDKRLAQEEAWIRQGIKARRTRNEGRVRALKALRETRRERRELGGNARMQVQDAERSGKLVVEARNVSHGYGGQALIRDFSTTILRGDKVGLIGPNGVGKTTLLRILLGQLQPDAGSVRLGTKLEVAYFDQHRSQLDEEKPVLDNVAGGREKLTIGGRDRHVISYLQDFLFPPERARTPVKALSGGERNRLLLARLFAQPANVLVMDEPTNDLDVETLELLEELLADFPGTLLLVSHDRAFLDNVVTGTLAFEGDGQVNEYVGGYEDWLRQRPAREEKKKAGGSDGEKKPKVSNKDAAGASAPPARKLSYKEKRELESLPAIIEALDAEMEALHQRMASPDFYQEGGDRVAAAKERLESIEAELAAAYERWEVLEG